MLIYSERISSNEKWNVVEIPIIYIKEMGQCPLCDRYFPDLHCCYYHLFCECGLSTKEGSKNAINVMYWLQNFFMINKNSLRNFILLYGANRDCFLRKGKLNLENSVICKHCKLELPDTISLKLHFEEEHCDRVDEGVVCFLCDFKALDDEKLGYHYSTCHLKCQCQNFAVHLKACPAKNNQANMPVPCSFCHKEFTVESVFVSHIIECKPVPEEVKINIDRIYPVCEICGQRILIIRLDEHLKHHIRRNETYIAHSNKQTKISVEDLKTNENYLDPEELREILFYLERNEKSKSV